MFLSANAQPFTLSDNNCRNHPEAKREESATALLDDDLSVNNSILKTENEFLRRRLIAQNFTEKTFEKLTEEKAEKDIKISELEKELAVYKEWYTEYQRALVVAQQKSNVCESLDSENRVLRANEKKLVIKIAQLEHNERQFKQKFNQLAAENEARHRVAFDRWTQEKLKTITQQYQGVVFQQQATIQRLNWELGQLKQSLGIETAVL
jgi:hypothetical protein